MVKKFLLGALAAVLMVEGTLATTATADAAGVPKAKYTYTFDKADKNLVAVNRKDEDASTGKPINPVVPTKDSKKKVILKKGKKGKALYLDWTYGVQLKNMKLKSDKYTISFWVKCDHNISDCTPVFFAGNGKCDGASDKWVSITKQAWLGLDHSPVVWSNNAATGEFPWTSDISESPRNFFAKDAGWNHITITVGAAYGDAAATTEYLTKGEDAYTKGPNVVIYVNGEMYGTGTPVTPGVMDGKETAYLGINYWDVKLKGYIDELQIFDKALKEKQVQKLYKSVGGK